jgi:hypothetical protein
MMPRVLKKTLQGKLVKGNDAHYYFHNQISSSGFDTLRIGLPKIRRDNQSNNINLQALCDAIGATLHKVKYTNPANTSSILYTKEPKLHKLYYSTYGNKVDIGERFLYTNGVWIIEYKGVNHWIVDNQRSKYISLELYGLSQLDHNLGAVRFELLNLILGFYEPNKRPESKLVLMGYDFHIDLNKSYDETLNNLIIPYLWTVNMKRKNNQKLKLYPYEGKEKSCYFQVYNSNIERKTYCYDKKAKNDLLFELTRLEMKVRLKNSTALNNYDDLRRLGQSEMKRIGIL